MNKKRRLRNEKEQSSRDESGQYKRSCNCLMHDSWSFDSIFNILHITKSKCFSKKRIQSMKEQNFLSPYASNLCTACYKHFNER